MFFFSFGFGVGVILLYRVFAFPMLGRAFWFSLNFSFSLI